MKPGGSRLVGWLILISLVFVAAAGFVFLFGLEAEPPIPGVTASEESSDSIGDDGDGSGGDDPSRNKARRASSSRASTLEIPAIGVDTRVVSLGKNADGTLETPTDYDKAGWWSGGPSPGRHGAAVITGHVDSERSGPAVFHRLSELDAGDIVRYTTSSGKRVRFEIERSERYSKDDFPTLRVYGRTDGSKLRLITCTGDFDAGSGHYRDNLIVFARRI